MVNNQGHYAIRMDGALYVCRGDKIEEVEDLTNIRGNRLFVSDLDGAISRAMTIEAPYKYAEVMVKKHLQEAGEFDEPITVVTHWKKKKDANATDIFFTALATRLYYQYIDQIKAHEDSILLFPLYSVLYGVLKRMRMRGPDISAVIFQHDRYADLIIGSGKRIFYANRSVAFDDNEEQISSLWGMVMSDIEQTEKGFRIKVKKILMLNWLNSHAWPNLPDDTDHELSYMKEEALFLNGESFSVSFLKALRMQSASDSVSGTIEKASYCFQRSLPCLNIIFFLFILTFIIGCLWCDHKAGLIETDLKNRRAQVSVPVMGDDISNIPSYEDHFAFIKELDQYRKSPSFKQLINDLSSSFPEGMFADIVKADYTGNELNVEVFARIKAPFDTAYKSCQRFSRAMLRKGYTLEKSEFNTAIQESRFLVRFKKG